MNDVGALMEDYPTQMASNSLTYIDSLTTSTNLYLSWTPVTDNIAKGGRYVYPIGYDLKWDQGSNNLTPLVFTNDTTYDLTSLTAGSTYNF